MPWLSFFRQILLPNTFTRAIEDLTLLTETWPLFQMSTHDQIWLLESLSLKTGGATPSRIWIFNHPWRLYAWNCVFWRPHSSVPQGLIDSHMIAYSEIMSRGHYLSPILVKQIKLADWMKFKACEENALSAMPIERRTFCWSITKKFASQSVLYKKGLRSRWTNVLVIRLLRPLIKELFFGGL